MRMVRRVRYAILQAGLWAEDADSMRLTDMTAARSIPGSTQKVHWQPFYDAHLNEPAHSQSRYVLYF